MENNNDKAKKILFGRTDIGGLPNLEQPILDDNDIENWNKGNALIPTSIEDITGVEGGLPNKIIFARANGLIKSPKSNEGCPVTPLQQKLITNALFATIKQGGRLSTYCMIKRLILVTVK